MILSWSFQLLEQAGCLASLQLYLVHWVSLVRDLTLSPEGLRVPARARLFIQNFVGGFGFLVAVELSFHIDCAVTEREDAVHLGGVLDWDFCSGFEPRFWVEDHNFHLGGFWWSLRRYFNDSHLASAQSLGGQRNSRRGCFSEVGNFWYNFWVLLGLVSRGGFQIFNSFRHGE